MRIIIFGLGAIGGTVAAALHLAGTEIVGIARGAQLDAIRANGLTLRSPDGVATARLPCVGHPSEIDFRPDDAVLLTVKTQDSVAAMDALRDAGLRDQPVFCAQNGVANERFALRRFPNVHGVTVMMPAVHLVPGEVACFSTPRHGIFEIGRYPSGADSADEALAAALNAANVAAFVTPDIMAGKYGKLVLNLGNVIEAAIGRGPDASDVLAIIRDEARAVLSAAGIAFNDVATDPRRDELMRQKSVDGVERIGGSSTQSLARGAGSIETDWLNGEIVLLGRLHGVPTPANEYCVALGARLVREKRPPASIPLAEIEAALGLAG